MSISTSKTIKLAAAPRGVWSGNPFVLLWGTMVGKKVVMAVTGIVLIGFVVAHMLGNLKIFLGAPTIDTYAAFLRTMGEPLFPYSALLWLARIVLIACVVLHITAAVELTRMNWAARPQGYDTKHTIATTYAARTTRWSGVILALFIIYHLLHLTGVSWRWLACACTWTTGFGVCSRLLAGTMLGPHRPSRDYRAHWH
jgi:succinate dehydrogenase / fumarate reductase cytochrome b subunit